MVPAQKVTLTRLDAATAAAMLAGLEKFDPRGIATAADLGAMTAGGECFALTDDAGAQCIYVIRVRNGQAWIQAAAGHGAADVTALTLPTIELQASHLQSVAFQTMRPGLVRKASKLGYRVTGWILRKDLPCAH